MKQSPEIVRAWIKSNGDIYSAPSIDEIASYGSGWRAWWKALQPKGRIGAREWPLLKRGWVDGSEWEQLKKGSTHGFIVLLVTLLWWDENAKTALERKVFDSTLEDVHFVIKHLVEASDGGQMRSRKRSRVEGRR